MNNLKEINGKYYKECSIVILSTNKVYENGIVKQITSSLIERDKDINNLFIAINSSYIDRYNNNDPNPLIQDFQPQHIYIISNEDFVHPSDKYTPYYDGIDTIRFSNTGNCYSLKAKNIIATTNNSLWNNTGKILPQLSMRFIDNFIREYNKGNIITKVLVQYEKISCNGELIYSHDTEDSIENSESVYICNKCKDEQINPSKSIFPNVRKCYKPLDFKLKIIDNNSVIIKLSRIVYTKDEVKNILFKYAMDNGLTSAKSEINDFNNWIAKNL